MALNNSNIASIRRQAKNVVCNYSDAQVKVREATSNDPWGPSSSLMSEIADLTHNAMAFTEVMQMIWKRLNDHGKNWRHVYKSLVLLDYLIKTGSDKVAQQCKENIYSVETLKDFQHIEDNKDQGMNVREKAKQMVTLLKDEERLKNERTRAMMARKRFAQNSMGISSDGQSHPVTRRPGRMERNNSELEEARPTSAGEEELQLQIALALSREEQQREDELTKGDDVRLQMAMEESKTNKISRPTGDNSAGGQQSSSSAVDDLLSLSQPSHSDPWSSAPSGSGAVDPWAPAPPPTNDPWLAPPPPAQAQAPAPVTTVNDPWAPAVSGSPPQAAAAPLSMNNGTSAWDNQYGANNGTSGVDMWNLDPLANAIVNGEQGQNRAGTKTPETFLGENSALVNLDDLMGASKPVAPAAAPKAVASNPFATSVYPPSTAANPFLAQQRPSPTLNQMRAESGNSTSIGNDWSLPPPLQPQGQAQTATNPFL